VMTIDSKPMMQFLAIGRPCQLNVNQIWSLPSRHVSQYACGKIRPCPNLICL
jgi:hypothetical protein